MSGKKRCPFLKCVYVAGVCSKCGTRQSEDGVDAPKGTGDRYYRARMRNRKAVNDMRLRVARKLGKKE